MSCKLYTCNTYFSSNIEKGCIAFTNLMLADQCNLCNYLSTLCICILYVHSNHNPNRWNTIDSHSNRSQYYIAYNEIFNKSIGKTWSPSEDVISMKLVAFLVKLTEEVWHQIIIQHLQGKDEYFCLSYNVLNQSISDKNHDIICYQQQYTYQIFTLSQ